MRTICTIFKHTSQLVIFTAFLLGCKPEGNGSGASSVGDPGAIVPNNLVQKGGKQTGANLLFGIPAEEMAGVYLGLNEEEKIHEFVLFEKSHDQGRCLIPTLDLVDNSEKELRFVFVNLPQGVTKLRFTSPSDAASQQAKITFASEARNSEQDLRVVSADRGLTELNQTDGALVELKIEASQSNQSKIQGNLKLLNCSPNKVSFVFPGFPVIANTFKRYIEVTLTAAAIPNNIAPPKITIHLDAMQKPSEVSVSPGIYNISAQLIGERKEGLQVLKSTKTPKALNANPGRTSRVDLILSDLENK